MRMTSKKKEILTFFTPQYLEWVTKEIGAPPLDVSGIAYLLHGMESFEKRHHLESTRRTLDAMVKDGLLEKVISYERRQNTTQNGDGKGVWCNCSRYGLPGQCNVMQHDGDVRRPHIEGESIRIN
ncbi:hypothetical protein NVX43_000192 [Salmonella enterica]|uniref:hypothetical protein n=1 Tax=Citrobacter freundii TaxID=546 RepID=UPI0012CCB564|nr:hypothetical protein [Citrobacter freundii]EDH5010741.1 hypothetical protein [Salmonella enterica subsp. enterica serovar Muenchen]EIM5736235.1 hypothetical protein [Salmonella enterica]EIS2178420.1 hypothetical protein [Salmonella enterica]EIS2228752.1 hypothetical protein [Salmonella enterica]EJP8592040.1 hypothetical protein [Salmonella enterica]